MSKKGIRINIAIAPEGVVSKRVIGMSQKFRAKRALFTLSETNHIPHITLYVAKFPEKNTPAILGAIRNLAHDFPHFGLTAASYAQTKNNYVEINYKKTRTLSLLQKNIIHSVNRLRENLPNHTALRYTNAEKRNLKRYGYDRVFKEFGPHLSLARLPAGTPTVGVQSFPPVRECSFRTETLDVFLVGKHHTCEKMIGRFPLRGKRG